MVPASSSMKTRPLGSTGLQVPVLGFGASSLGSVFREVSLDDCIATVQAALEGGMNFIDVSPSYGETLAELRLGRALEGVPRESYLLATKIGSYSEPRGDYAAALRALFDAGVFTHPIVPPAVPVNSARLRVSMSAEHSTDQVDRVLDAFAQVARTEALRGF